MTAPPTSADVVIVGGGIMGLTTAERLTARGHRVIVVDDTGATGGATSVSGGLVRAFEPTAAHAAWAAESCAVYQARGPHGDWPALREDGSLTLIDRSGLRRATAALDVAHSAGHEAEVLTPGDIARRFPSLTVPDHLLGVLEPHAGWLPAADVARAVRRDAGDRLKLHTDRATALLHSDARIRGVRTTTGTVYADAVLLAAGAGSEPLAASVGVRLPLRTRAIGYCLFRTESSAGLPTVVDHTTGAWLRPWGDGETVLAGVTSTVTGVPITVRRDVSATEEQRVRAVLKDRCPALAHAPVVGGVAAYDCLTTDGPGTVTAWPRPRGLVTAVGWNGGGFKLAPAVGRHTADRIVEVLAR
ncbi:FAD-binding oxidoreductase [Streptomyces spinoverrucosus]|uniref:NAD(P)/FAD-dependent oxidoreductase n=1 Tax=Streptomyces spinoverrucosus TaxID=284043 RepID=UPI0018C3E591|nr:FAD-binding oxidoreductase [Streptomyces spinoverrucosus]MBG0855460.1 FAD-binding oxidoreductase [Streptomyces spinoverrucosus]